MPITISLYITYSVIIAGYLSLMPLKKETIICFYDVFLVGFAVLSYIALLMMQLKLFPLFATILHAQTIAGTAIAIILNKNLFSLKRYETGENSRQTLLFILIIICLTFYLRFPVSNFLFEVGDAGSYVNSANNLVRTGIKSTQFFPLNQIWIAIFSALAGVKNAAFFVAYISTLATVAFYFLIRELLQSRKTALIAMLLLSVNILAIWFGRIPYSESLMAFLNIAILYLFISQAKSQKNKQWLFIVLISLYVGLAGFTRVTGIIWMAIVTVDLFYKKFISNQYEKEALYTFICSMTAYLLSVWYGLVSAPTYYIQWQLKKWIGFLDTPQKIVIFHALWFISALLIYYVLGRLQTGKIKKNISKKDVLTSVILFFGLIIAGNYILTKSFEEIFFVAAIIDIASGSLPVDGYYLYNFFSPFSLICFPIGIFLAFKYYNPVKEPRYSILWWFALGFLLIHYSRVVYYLAHSVYLYWLRYFISEILILFLIILTITIHYALKWGKITKIVGFVLIFSYIAQSSYWITTNYHDIYLGNAYEMLSSIASVVPKRDTVLFQDVHYSGTEEKKWVYPNFNACILVPLKRSFGFTVFTGDESKNPYDQRYNQRRLKRVINANKTAYILSVSLYGDREPLSFRGLSGVDIVYKGRINSFVNTKNFDPKKLYGTNLLHHEITIDIWSVKKFIYRPYQKDRFIKLKGFYPQSIFTNGKGVISGLSYKVNSSDRYFVLGTKGYHPLKGSPEKLNLAVLINDLKMQFSHEKEKKYFFKLPDNLNKINEVRIESSTFIPKELGINDSVKTLGIDVDYITIN